MRSARTGASLDYRRASRAGMRGGARARSSGLFAGGTLCAEAQLILLRARSHGRLQRADPGRRAADGRRRPARSPDRSRRRRIHARPAASDDRSRRCATTCCAQALRRRERRRRSCSIVVHRLRRACRSGRRISPPSLARSRRPMRRSSSPRSPAPRPTRRSARAQIAMLKEAGVLVAPSNARRRRACAGAFRDDIGGATHAAHLTIPAAAPDRDRRQRHASGGHQRHLARSRRSSPQRTAAGAAAAGASSTTNSSSRTATGRWSARS